ncbi:MAG: endonuclease/exonuclease/phosphatase family protein [Tannerellaceae bacterium]|jgi:endonuclease/exonuclease/phosphatase family metal-dependent hydrolase|nr:endonuclease/exonuclease/phosphatase family protein [Tannerellaceae bacterium]
MNKMFFLLALGCTFLACNTPQETIPLRIATYNLRMDTPADSLNAWSYRKENVKALIRHHHFDIVGTQEGFRHQLDNLAELPEYTAIGAGRDDGLSAGEHSAILYRTDKFLVVDSGNFWLSETPDVPGKGWDATCCNRICSWVKFCHRESGAEFYVFNVHFDHQGVVARRESGKLMIRKIQEIAGQAPVICTGDFNSHPGTEQIQTLSAFLHDARTVTATSPYGPEGTFNGRFTNPVHPERIDYIFLSNHFQVDSYAVLTDNNGLYYPSDHLPVAADVHLIPQR